MSLDLDVLSWQDRLRLWGRLLFRAVAVLLLFFLIRRWGGQMLTLAAPFLLALPCAAVLDRPVRILQKRLGWSRSLLTLMLSFLLFGVITGVVGALFYTGWRELLSLTEHWGDLLQGARDLIQRLDDALREAAAMLPFPVHAPEGSILGALLQEFQEAVPDLGSLLREAGSRMRTVSDFLLALPFFLMAVYFLTADLPYLRTRLAEGMSDSMRAFCRQLNVVALGAFGGYLKAQVLLSCGVFGILFVGFLVTKQNYGLLLATLLAILDFIPILGAGTVMIPWAVIDLCTGNYRAALGLLVIWGVIALFRRFAEPRFVGTQTGLSPLLSLMSVWTGLKLWGIWGMVLTPVLLLMILNLAATGLFHSLRRDLREAWRDLRGLALGRP